MRWTMILLVLSTSHVAAVSAAPKTTYLARCSMCHQANAQGLPGQFPRLAGRGAQIAQTVDGRNYMISVVLHGMYGAINVDSQTVTGLMPSLAAMTDIEIAEALNFVTTAGKPAKAAAPFKATEVATVRAAPKVSGGENAEMRQKLLASGIIK